MKRSSTHTQRCGGAGILLAFPLDERLATDRGSAEPLSQVGQEFYVQLLLLGKRHYLPQA